jgi:hypothetical protein
MFDVSALTSIVGDGIQVRKRIAIPQCHPQLEKS